MKTRYVNTKPTYLQVSDFKSLVKQKLDGQKKKILQEKMVKQKVSMSGLATLKNFSTKVIISNQVSPIVVLQSLLY